MPMQNWPIRDCTGTGRLQVLGQWGLFLALLMTSCKRHENRRMGWAGWDWMESVNPE
jgi:hypothetical protein